MNISERRKFKRLAEKFDIYFSEIGSSNDKTFYGHTIDVSPAGLYFQTTADVFKHDNIPQGELLKVELSIPPTKGVLEFGGKISGFAKLLRISDFSNSLSDNSYGVAVEFCQSPKLSI